MKKYVLSALALFFLFACQKPAEQPQEKEEIIYSVVGVWSDGTYYLSFNDAGYYCAYLDEHIINNGTYKQIGNEKIECEYNWRTMIPFGRNTYFTINKIDDKSMTVRAVSTDASDNKFEKDYTLTKTEITPSPEENAAIGNSWKYLASSGEVKITLVSADIGMKTHSKTPMSLHPIDFYYVYIGDTIYYQNFFIADNATIGGWTENVGTGKVMTVAAMNFGL